MSVLQASCPPKWGFNPSISAFSSSSYCWYPSLCPSAGDWNDLPSWYTGEVTWRLGGPGRARVVGERQSTGNVGYASIHQVCMFGKLCCPTGPLHFQMLLVAPSPLLFRAGFLSVWFTAESPALEEGLTPQRAQGESLLDEHE